MRSNNQVSNKTRKAAAEWEPESPFLNLTVDPADESGGPVSDEAPSTWPQMESPFISEYEAESSEAVIEPEMETIIQVMAELHDEEFDEAVYALANEAAELLENRYENEYESEFSSGYDSGAMQFLENHYAPMVNELEMLLERMAQSAAERMPDATAASEEELDRFMDQFAPDFASYSPAVEDFFGKLWKKVKKVAKKGISLAKKLNPLNMVFKKLKKIIRPLLKRVLKFALNKLPRNLQPIARTLAGKFLKETEEESYDEEPAAEVEWIQEELDYQAAAVLSLETDVETDNLIQEYVSGSQTADPGSGMELEAARERFINDITRLEQGENPGPVIENFVTAVLTAIRIGVRIIGRKRVINFLAGHLSKLLARYIGKKYAAPLSRAIVNAGFKLLRMEVSEELETAGDVIASTVEETVRETARLPEYVLDDEVLLEGYVLDIFEAAVGRNFPSQLVKDEFKEAPELNASWLRMPGGRKKHYKKFGKIFDVVLTPRMAEAIQTFNGKTLVDFFKVRSGQPLKRGIPVKVHVYEAIAGTRLNSIAKYERNVPGLGSPSQEAESQIHPLSRAAAGLLLQQPRLGKDMPVEYLKSRHKIAVGQRFFYLEMVKDLPRAIRPPKAVGGRHSQVNVTVDFPDREIRIYVYLNEADAQDIAAKVRQGVSPGSLLRIIRKIYAPSLKSIGSRVKLVHEAFIFNKLKKIGFGKGYILKRLGKLLYKWTEIAIRNYLAKHIQDFVRATENSTGGVTLKIKAGNLDWLKPLGAALKGNVGAIWKVFKNISLPSLSINLKKGFHRD